ncbi:hypothetical protein DPMN_180566 [Dreissena polymorpha]|uniref:Uncharacterized protein n=1 Tax=Dreissena polymorpha TaxID=45954 RepID=A0A9D4EJD7_DREPO|nr:hypothetical protein DPMN_180566 [Dreissena polymorpha]
MNIPSTDRPTNRPTDRPTDRHTAGQPASQPASKTDRQTQLGIEPVTSRSVDRHYPLRHGGWGGVEGCDEDVQWLPS